MSEENLDNLYIQNLKTEDFVAFGATPAELVAYALDEVGLLGSHTLIEGKSARNLVEKFYSKRHRVRQNTRLGTVLIRKQVITQQQLMEALSYHMDKSMPLGQCLVELQFCTQKDLDTALEQQAQMRRFLD